MSRRPPRITFVTRADCSLCDHAYARVLPIATRLGVDVEVVDVDADAEFLGRFGTDVPVVLSERGAVLAAGKVDSLHAWFAVWRARLGRAG